MDFKTYVLHQLREMKREVITAIQDLETEDLTSFEPCDHWPIAWIAEHCTQVVDGMLCAPVADGLTLEYPEHILKWQQREPVPGDSYPELPELISRWQAVCDRAIELVEGATEEDLQKQHGHQPYIQSILLVINHTNSHLRSLWCILGERRVDTKWAEQQSYLA